MIHVLQHVEIEHLGLIEPILRERGLSYRYVRLFAGEALPAPIPQGDGLIVLGGPASVHDPSIRSAMKKEIELVSRAIKDERPVLGICLGAQIMATALGARIYAAPAKEVGCSPVSLTEIGAKDAVFEGFERSFVVFQWHGDTFDIPRQARRIARGTLVPNQAFAVGKSAYALQFHLEATAEMMDALHAASPGDARDAGVTDFESVRTIFAGCARSMELDCRRFVENFLRAAGLA